MRVVNIIISPDSSENLTHFPCVEKQEKVATLNVPACFDTADVVDEIPEDEGFKPTDRAQGKPFITDL